MAELDVRLESVGSAARRRRLGALSPKPLHRLDSRSDRGSPSQPRLFRGGWDTVLRMEVELRPTTSGVALKRKKRKKNTLASVFIVESVSFDDERAGRLEGGILSQILELSGKASEYFYIRTKKEFEAVLKEFERSGMRYLHISCHGNSKSLFTTLDDLPFEELRELLIPYLKKRRLFISACEAANCELADAVMPESGCYSIVGPARDVGFDEAAVMWAAFYNLMFRQNPNAMKKADIHGVLDRSIETFGIPMTYIQRTTTRPFWREVTLGG